MHAFSAVLLLPLASCIIAYIIKISAQYHHYKHHRYYVSNRCRRYRGYMQLFPSKLDNQERTAFTVYYTYCDHWPEIYLNL